MIAHSDFLYKNGFQDVLSKSWGKEVFCVEKNTLLWYSKMT